MIPEPPVLKVSQTTTLKIQRLARGGYIVIRTGGQTDVGRHSYLEDPLFASLDIDEALAFIKEELGDPEVEEKEPEQITEAEVARRGYQGIV